LIQLETGSILNPSQLRTLRLHANPGLRPAEPTKREKPELSDPDEDFPSGTRAGISSNRLHSSLDAGPNAALCWHGLTRTGDTEQRFHVQLQKLGEWSIKIWILKLGSWDRRREEENASAVEGHVIRDV
jgi:hypothetical protein